MYILSHIERFHCTIIVLPTTVEPPNKGHFGDNINSAVVSFVERLSSLRRFKMY